MKTLEEQGYARNPGTSTVQEDNMISNQEATLPALSEEEDMLNAMKEADNQEPVRGAVSKRPSNIPLKVITKEEAPVETPKSKGKVVNVKLAWNISMTAFNFVSQGTLDKAANTGSGMTITNTGALGRIVDSKNGIFAYAHPFPEGAAMFSNNGSYNGMMWVFTYEDGSERILNEAANIKMWNFVLRDYVEGTDASNLNLKVVADFAGTDKESREHVEQVVTTRAHSIVIDFGSIRAGMFSQSVSSHTTLQGLKEVLVLRPKSVVATYSDRFFQPDDKGLGATQEEMDSIGDEPASKVSLHRFLKNASRVASILVPAVTTAIATTVVTPVVTPVVEVAPIVEIVAPIVEVAPVILPLVEAASSGLDAAVEEVATPSTFDEKVAARKAKVAAEKAAHLASLPVVVGNPWDQPSTCAPILTGGEDDDDNYDDDDDDDDDDNNYFNIS